MSTRTLEHLEIIFSCCHDGFIETVDIDEHRIRLKIALEYLAELINPMYGYFFLELIDIEYISYQGWGAEIIEDHTAIFSLELGILNAKLNEAGILQIATDCINAPQNAFQGGMLSVKCNDYALLNEAQETLAVTTLQQLSTEYWQ